MTTEIRVGLIGDYNASVPAHQAIPVALQMIATEMARPVVPEWIPTEEIQDEARVSEFDALWCVPASPYRDMEGALRALRFARAAHRAFLGTCGGFNTRWLSMLEMSWAGPMPNTARRRYRCSYGLNPEFQARLTSGPLRASAEDERGDVRAIELDEHPFFVATLFQPERVALTRTVPPLVRAFVRSVA